MTRVICRAVQRDVVKDLPTHVDFLRLAESRKINLFIHVDFINEEESPGLKRGGVLTVVRHEVELIVTAGDIPDHITVDLAGTDISDTDPHFRRDASGRREADHHRPRLRDRQHPAPSGLRASDAAEEDGEDEEEATEE